MWKIKKVYKCQTSHKTLLFSLLFLNMCEMFGQVVFQTGNASLVYMNTIFCISFHDRKYCDFYSYFRFSSCAEKHVVSADKTGWLLAKPTKKEFQNRQLWQKGFTRTANQCQTLAKISRTADYLINPQLRRNSFVWKQTCSDIDLRHIHTLGIRAHSCKGEGTLICAQTDVQHLQLLKLACFEMIWCSFGAHWLVE